MMFRSERGQVLVLILIAIAGLMGFAALVVDGGHLYSERRRAQSAADAAALAAASAGSKDQSDTSIAAIVSSQANQNGFFNGANNTVVTYNHPPVSGPYVGNAEYYQVVITQSIAPIFSQFVFQGTQTITTEAIARARPTEPLTGDNAMMALATCSCGPAIVLDGGTEMTIRGGKVFSNEGGIRNTNGGGNGIGDIRIYKDPDPTKTDPGEIDTYGGWPEDKRDKMYANFVTATGTVALDKVPAPYCPASNTTINGVDYYVWNGPTMTTDLAAMNQAAGKSRDDYGLLPPGIHCVTGDLKMNGTYKELKGYDVLLVLTDSAFVGEGNVKIDLTRADSLIDANGNQWGGMVLYSHYSSPNYNHNNYPIEWRFGGNSHTVFNGTLLAPNATCDLGGTPENQNIHGAFVCWDFKIHGTPHIRITYIPEENWQLPPSLSLVQ